MRISTDHVKAYLVAVQVACAEFGISQDLIQTRARPTIEEIRSGKRTSVICRKACNARAAIAKACHDMMGISYPVLCNLMEMRDHTSVMSARNRADAARIAVGKGCDTSDQAAVADVVDMIVVRWAKEGHKCNFTQLV